MIGLLPFVPVDLQRRPLTAVLAAAVLLAGVRPVAAATKEQIHGEMIALAEEMAAAKGEPARAADYARLSARYDALSARLGGDRPGQAPAWVAGPGQGVLLGGPGVPPGCVEELVFRQSLDTPVPIPDLATVSSTILIPPTAGFLHDVDVQTFINHTFAADLDITLTSPMGTEVTLTTDNGGLFDDVFSGTIWDDHARTLNPPGPVTDILFADGVTETPVIAEEALAAFRGEPLAGPWTLTIVDDTAIDVGILFTWNLRLLTLATAPIDLPSAPIPSLDPPLPITDLATTISTVTITGLDGYLCDLELSTSITHTFAGDLDIGLFQLLPGPPLTVVTTDNGDGADDVFDGTLWDDDRGFLNPPGPVTDNTIVSGVLETPLVVEGALGAFIGADPNTTWVLTVFDDAAFDSGVLEGWSLTPTTCRCGMPILVPAIPTLDPSGLAVLLTAVAGAAIVLLRRRGDSRDRSGRLHRDA
jgi:subtilisin-like proprotein convertase family protein